jgi:hypothetical protein
VARRPLWRSWPAARTCRLPKLDPETGTIGRGGGRALSLGLPLLDDQGLEYPALP